MSAARAASEIQNMSRKGAKFGRIVISTQGRNLALNLSRSFRVTGVARHFRVFAPLPENFPNPIALF
jgi:hypothetical protein